MPAEDFDVTPAPASLRFVVPAPTVRFKSNLWYNWARIAVEHEKLAVVARSELLRAWSGPNKSGDLLTEMHAAMVAVVASAHAFDALHAEIAPIVSREPDPRSEKGRRRRQWEYMLDSFKGAIPAAEHWRPELDWLFKQRDHAVHFQGVFHAPEAHLELPTHVSAEINLFSKESAVRAVDCFLRVFAAIAREGEPVSLLTPWGDGVRQTLLELEALRTNQQRH